MQFENTMDSSDTSQKNKTIEEKQTGEEAEAISKKKRWKSIFLATLISIVCFIILFKFIDIVEVFSAIRKISISVLVGSLLLYTISYWFRAWKFKVLFDHAIPMRHLFALVCAHTMASSILPARTGELTYFYFRKKVNKDHTLANSIVSLAVIRIFDLAALLVIFLLSVILIAAFPTNVVLPESIMTILWTSAAGIMLIIFLLGICIIKGNVMIMVLQKIMSILHLNKYKLFRWVENKGVEIITTLNSITKKQVLILLFASLMIWGGNFFIGYLIVKDIGLFLPFSFIMMGFVATTLANALPIHGFASLGSLEGIWTLIFVALGAKEKIAITSGIGFHLVVIAYLLLFGFSGITYLHWKKDKD